MLKQLPLSSLPSQRHNVAMSARGIVSVAIRAWQQRLREWLRQIPRERLELALTVVLAVVFANVLYASPLLIGLVAIMLVLVVPVALSSPLYMVVVLVVLLPFRDVHLISIIHLKRFIIWTMLAYMLARQITPHPKSFSQGLAMFTKVSAGFLLVLAASLIQTAALFQTSTEYRTDTLKTIIFSDALVVLEALLIVYIVYYGLAGMSQVGRLLDAMLLVSAGVAVLGILQYYSGGIPKGLGFLFWPNYVFYGRATSIFPNPNGLGGFLAPMVSASVVALFFQQCSRWKRFGFFLPVLLCNLSAAFLSFSRMAMAQILFSLVLIGGIYYTRIQRLKISWQVVVVVVLNIGLLVGSVQFYERFAQLRTRADSFQIPSLALERIKAVSDATRLHAAQKALQTFSEHPVLGIGYGGLTQRRDLMLTWVENQYLKLLAEMGFLGGLLFVMMLGVIVRSGLRLWKIGRRPLERDEQLTLMILVVGVMTHAFGYLFAESLYNISRTGFLWVWAGVIFAVENYLDKEMNSR